MWESRNVKFEEIGKATVSQTHQECPLKNVSRCIVFCSFHDVVAVLRCSIRIEERVSRPRCYGARRRRERRGNKADRTKKTRGGYLGVKRKKNNRSPISRSVPETCPKIPADIKNFCGRNERERENNDTDKRWNHVTDWFWKIGNVCASYTV